MTIISNIKPQVLNVAVWNFPDCKKHFALVRDDSDVGTRVVLTNKDR